MHDDRGFQRPKVDPTEVDRAHSRRASRTFDKVCPGVVVRAQHPPGSTRDPYLGPILGIWEAYATDAEVRSRGSSGGTITALAAWLTETGRTSRVIAAQADRSAPRRTVSVTVMSRAEVVATAGSRYAPVSNASAAAAVEPGSAFVGKPCEVTALRALEREGGPAADVLLSFFCAGTPSQGATDDLVTRLGLESGQPLADLWYRGRGWPGQFTAVPVTGEPVSTTYQESWAKSLGPTVQWRCRLCADGVGESADVTAGDFWRSDQRGYPDFTEQDGLSVLIARTPKGLALVQEAVASGVLVVREVDPADVSPMQPAQVQRRKYLLGRLIGTLVFRVPVTRYRGFGLLGFAARSPRRSFAELRGTVSRRRRHERLARGLSSADISD